VKALELVGNEFPVVVSIVSNELYGVGAMQSREIVWAHYPMDGVSCTPVYQGQRCFQLRLAASEAVVDWRRSHAAGEPPPLLLEWTVSAVTSLSAIWPDDPSLRRRVGLPSGRLESWSHGEAAMLGSAKSCKWPNHRALVVSAMVVLFIWSRQKQRAAGESQAAQQDVS